MRNIFAILFNPESTLSRVMIALILGGLFAAGAAGYLKPVETLLDSEELTFRLGSFTLSLYKLLKGITILIMVFWLASIISSTGEKYIRRIKIRNSNKVLIAKAFQIVTYFLFGLMALDVLGIDLTALTVFSGAVGIGVGFGLQKVTSNFISGLILLFERSVEEGDLVELDGGIFGHVRHTGARYTLVEGFDGKEIMIPNEDFITQRVTNWTYTSNKARVEVSVGVAYECDIEKARELMLEAARAHPRCARTPAPQCFMLSFGDSAINLTLYFWVDNVLDGRYEPQSDVMRAIWKKFKENNISIPYPQREVLIKNPAALQAAN